MDKEVIVLMLKSIKESSSIGPKVGTYNPGERIIFAEDKKLVERTTSGNFYVTQKGLDLLVGNLDWHNL